MTDNYTKFILTVIAIALCAIAFKDILIPTVQAHDKLAEVRIVAPVEIKLREPLRLQNPIEVKGSGFAGRFEVEVEEMPR